METRDKLLEATLRLVVDKGVEKTTMSDITEMADLGRRTFYYHFASKEESVLAATAGAYEKHAQAFAHTSREMDPALAVALTTRNVTSALVKEPITARLTDLPRLLATALSEALGSYIADDIRVGIEAGRFRPSMTGGSLRSILIWCLVGLIIEVIENQINFDEVIESMVSTYLIILGVDSAEAESIGKQVMG